MFKYIKKLVLNFIADKFGIPELAIDFVKPMSIVGQQGRADYQKI